MDKSLASIFSVFLYDGSIIHMIQQEKIISLKNINKKINPYENLIIINNKNDDLINNTNQQYCSSPSRHAFPYALSQRHLFIHDRTILRVKKTNHSIQL